LCKDRDTLRRRWEGLVVPGTSSFPSASSGTCWLPVNLSVMGSAECELPGQVSVPTVLQYLDTAQEDKPTVLTRALAVMYSEWLW
jgi:hypothetical protein